MISMHTRQSIPAAELMRRGALTHLGAAEGTGLFRLDIPANPTTGVGPVGSNWLSEVSDSPALTDLPRNVPSPA